MVLTQLMSSTKSRLSSLHLPSSANLLTHNLNPDPATGGSSVSAFINHILSTGPSIQRRARLARPQVHYSFVTPFPVSFPYSIEPPDDIAEIQDKSAYIETWLAKREARNIGGNQNSPQLKLYYPAERAQSRVLIGLSETGLRDCIPHLDVGDAFALIGEPSLSGEFTGEGDVSTDKETVAARQEMIDVLSGHAVLMSEDYPKSEGTVGFAPWSLRYSGHQFGTWAGQLGDGRAVSVLVTPHPTNSSEVYELQLKGAGRTPYSRSADGLAVLRSSIREYLCSEAMAALSIPTTRALSLIALPDLSVQRERIEFASILTRMAPSFIRIGSFEAVSPPGGRNMMFFGGGQQEPDWDALMVLGEWVAFKVLKLDGSVVKGDAPWGRELVLEVGKRNAKTVAAWQAYGFMHGVINTDNVSVLGLTIDYGPYAFMDTFDPLHICNHTDDGGRYSYKYQPNMIIYALRALLDALSPLIGAELDTSKRVSSGWATSASQEKLSEWRKLGRESVIDELERVIQETTSVEYARLMRKRLGLRRVSATDKSKIFGPLLRMMENQKLDFHRTFRVLCGFKLSMVHEEASEDLAKFVDRLLSSISEPQMVDRDGARKEWGNWLRGFAERIESERDEWRDEGATEQLDERRDRMTRAANPRFVLRQWMLEEVIKKVERDPENGRRVLAKVMHMACNPFEAWGAEETEGIQEEDDLSKEQQEERRYCGVGDSSMLGFQCSCSS